MEIKRNPFLVTLRNVNGTGLNGQDVQRYVVEEQGTGLDWNVQRRTDVRETMER